MPLPSCRVSIGSGPEIPVGGSILSSFTAENLRTLNHQDTPKWLCERRVESYNAFESMPRPSEKEEVWRYTPIDALDLDAYSILPALPRGASEVGQGYLEKELFFEPTRWSSTVSGDLGQREFSGNGLVGGAKVGGLELDAAEESLGSVMRGGDALVRLNDAFHPDAVVVDIPDGVRLGAPILIYTWLPDSFETRPAYFPRTLVRVGEGSDVRIVEVVSGPLRVKGALVVPVTEIVVGDGGSVSYVTLQTLGSNVWHIARSASRVGERAKLKLFTVGLGSHYDRVRVDVSLVGRGASSELNSVYLGRDDQVHDIRTQQDHNAPQTTSDLLCKGAVADSSRSVYSGLIRISHGAVRSEAMQTNHNLVLDESAHADSVPNLDIKENDVRCSHASTVGPIDEDRRFYVESRGVPPETAERLIVMGFFDDIVSKCPIEEADSFLRAEVGSGLKDALGELPGLPNAADAGQEHRSGSTGSAGQVR